MDDKDTPNRAANKDKAEGETWSSDPNTVERKDKEATEGSAQPAAGISNRPMGEEQENQASLPDRGKSKGGANAGHGHTDPKIDRD